MKLLPCCAGCAGNLKEAGLGVHRSLFHLLCSVQLARRSCHFFPGCVEPVSLVQRAVEPRSVMKGSVMYLPVAVLDLWEGCRQGAQRLYVLSWPSAETSIFLKGPSPYSIAGLSVTCEAPFQMVVMELLAKQSFRKKDVSFHYFFFHVCCHIWDF